MKLFEISSEYENIIDNLYDENGEINQSNLIRLQQNEIAMEEKAIAIASFIKNLNAEMLAINSAIKDMKVRENSCKKKIENLEDYLLTNMSKCGINNIKCKYFDIKIKKCPISVEVEDISFLEEEYTLSNTIITANKLKIKDEILKGALIKGASLKQNLRLEIK